MNATLALRSGLSRIWAGLAPTPAPKLVFLRVSSSPSPQLSPTPELGATPLADLQTHRLSPRGARGPWEPSMRLASGSSLLSLGVLRQQRLGGGPLSPGKELRLAICAMVQATPASVHLVKMEAGGLVHPQESTKMAAGTLQGGHTSTPVTISSDSTESD